MNKETLNELLRKVLFGLVGIFGPLTARFLADMNEKVDRIDVSIARIETALKLTESLPNKVESNTLGLFRLESDLQAQDRRLERIEQRVTKDGNRNEEH